MITALYLIKNEENFIKSSILSILPLVEKILIYDTGSTDSTLEIIKGIKSNKIEIMKRKNATPSKLTEYRNEMIERTKSEWFFIVDGDEIYSRNSVRIIEQVKKIPTNIVRLKVKRVNFINNLNFISKPQFLGRIFRTQKVRIRGEYPFEKPYLRENEIIDIEKVSHGLSEDIVCFHTCFLQRSSKDKDVSIGRHWRKIPFPVYAYFGPWPETLKFKEKLRKPNVRFILQLLRINLLALIHLVIIRLKNWKTNIMR